MEENVSVNALIKNKKIHPLEMEEKVSIDALIKDKKIHPLQMEEKVSIDALIKSKKMYPLEMEEKMSKDALIEQHWDNYTASPLVGLEYVVELQEENKEPTYFCTLCMKCGDPQFMLGHIVGILHKSKFLVINFPKVTNEIQKTSINMKATRLAKYTFVDLVCSKIEEKHGRGGLVVMDKQRFAIEKHKIIHDITVSHSHIRESPSDNYGDLFTPKYISQLDAQLEEKYAEQLVEDTEKLGSRNSFKDTKIGCDRSKLRMRKDDSDDKVMVIEKQREGGKVKSSSSVSSISSASMSSAASAEIRDLKPQGRGSLLSWRSRSRSPHRRSRSQLSRFHYRKSRSRTPYRQHGHLKSPARRHISRAPYRRSQNRYHRSNSRSPEQRSRSPYRESCLSEVRETVSPAAPDCVAREREIVASQIAAALVAKGKHNVTDEQLEALINTVINMAKSSQRKEASKKMDSTESAKAVMEPGVRGLNASDGDISGLQLLQSAYNEIKHSPKVKTTTTSNTDSPGDLSEEDFRVFLRNFKEIAPEEQHSLTDLLKEMEMTNPEKVERLRKYEEVEPDPQPTVSSWLNRKSSPLSFRDAGFNNPPKVENSKKLDSDSDHDYNYTDIFASASKNVKENEQKRKLIERNKLDAVTILRKANERVLNVLGYLPMKPITPAPFPQQPASVTPSTVSHIPVIQQQPRYRYPRKKFRRSSLNAQPPFHSPASVINFTSCSGHQKITDSSATYYLGYANQQHSFLNSSYTRDYEMQQQQRQQYPQPQHQQPHQQLPLQQQWTDENYRNSNPYSSHQTQPYNQYTYSY